MVKFERCGPWSLLRRVGRGGTSDVFLAQHVETGQRVALKRLRSTESEAIRQFQQEIALTKRCQDTHVVEFVSEGVDERFGMYFVLNWLDGLVLKDVLAKDRLSVLWFGEVAKQLCTVLESVHQRSVIHCDLTPSNLLVLGDRFQHVVLLDFGVACLYPQARSSKRLAVGTPLYLAPEQIRGKVTLTPAVDLYALGVILFECLTGALPIEGESFFEHTMLVLQDSPPLLGECASAFAETKWERLGASLLQKEPGQRPRSAVVVKSMLQDAIEEMGADVFLPHHQ